VKQFLAEAGPYLSILANLIGSAAGLCTGLQFASIIADTVTNMTSQPTEYFKEISEVINKIEAGRSATRDLSSLQDDPLNRVKRAQGPALREFKAFLFDNDPSREYGGLHRITMNDGRWRWVCNSCKEKAHGNHEH